MNQAMSYAKKETYDWVVIGGGIIGLSVARELRRRFPQDSIAIIEKEKAVGLHASGRNSGVLHAGIYYQPQSLKAKLCLEGRSLMSDYCNEHKLPIRKIGKIIIPSEPAEESEIERLYSNARTNGVNVSLLSGDDLRKLEPEANSSCNRALHSPDTVVVSPKAIMAHLGDHLQGQGVSLLMDREVKKINTVDKTVETKSGLISYGYLFNCGGAYADELAHQAGVGLQYSIFPFRGIYLQLDPSSKLRIRTNIYPVPDRKVPFLGVHFTPNTDGDVFIGPTATPTFGREHYTNMKGLDVRTLISAGPLLLKMYCANQQGMRTLMHNEIKRTFKSHFVKEAQKLVPRVTAEDMIACSKRGIRAQLFDKKKNAIEMDFVVESTKDSLHVLNAVSPAFTCGLSFASYLVNRI